ncbi:MAG: NUDIX hydrolase [Oscillospiraceae bacterium]|nr:NUDIX hydrolase [Oscillospiraceae bacterium]
MEYNDVYDRSRRLTGRTHLRGTKWKTGEYGLIVCVWVYDGDGKLLLTRRAPEKSYPGTWENSGGVAKAGETSRQAIARELFEETGIRADEKEFELLDSGREGSFYYDYYCLRRNTPISEIVLLPGETDGVQWVTFEQAHEMIEQKQICKVIARQFKRQEPMLLSRQKIEEKP